MNFSGHLRVGGFIWNLKTTINHCIQKTLNSSRVIHICISFGQNLTFYIPQQLFECSFEYSC